MQSENMELLQKLKGYLVDGTLTAEKFPLKNVMEIIRVEYDQWLSEKARQLGEYLGIYHMLTQAAMEREDNLGLSALLDELIRDLNTSSITACDRLHDLRDTVSRVLIESYRQKARDVYRQYQYQSKRGENAFKGKGVVYTVITGGYDELNPPACVSPEFDYVCFTDNRDLDTQIWDIRYVENPDGLDSVRLARKYKILCHKFLEEYDFSVYTDGKICVTGDLCEYMEIYSTGSPMLCFPHFVRECAYEEAKACMEASKDDPEKIISQMEGYKQEGYPANYGLIDSACLVRRHQDTVLQKVLECWWEEVKTKSRRDQLSIGYACWKNRFHYDLSDLFIYQNPYICKKRSWELPY